MTEPAHRAADAALTELADGDGSAAIRLLPYVYDELRVLAASYFNGQPSNHTLQPTALVHEAFLRLADQTSSRWQDRAHFFAVAAVAMRQILVSHARRRNTQKRGSGRRGFSIDDGPEPGIALDEDLLALDEALDELAKLDSRKARVVESRFFGGLTHQEIAGVLDVSLSTVESDWRFSRAWLAVHIGSDEP